jgi:hypothetical protein
VLQKNLEQAKALQKWNKKKETRLYRRIWNKKNQGATEDGTRRKNQGSTEESGTRRKTEESGTRKNQGNSKVATIN